jgi:hypothetical protein
VRPQSTWPHPTGYLTDVCPLGRPTSSKRPTDRLTIVRCGSTIAEVLRL